MSNYLLSRKAAAVDVPKPIDFKRVFVIGLPLFLWMTSAHADSPSSELGIVNSVSGTVAHPVADPIPTLLSKAMPSLESDTVCVPPAAILTPATLGGPNASPVEVTGIRSLHCLSLHDTLDISHPVLAFLPESRVLRTPPFKVITAAVVLTAARSRVSIGTGMSVLWPDIKVLEHVLTYPSGTPPLPVACGQRDGCDWNTARARPDTGTGAGLLLREVNIRAPHSARAPGGTNPWAAIALFLALWLPSLCVLGVGWWLVYLRWLAPDAKLVRAAWSGLRRGEFRLEYQPVVNVGKGKCVGVETLIRWNNTEFGTLGPLHYMSRLEHTRVISALTRFVLSTAARELGPLVEARSLYIGISVCAPHVESKAFVSDVRRSAKGILSRLVLHMPQSNCATPTTDVRSAVAALREKNVRFALSGVGIDPVPKSLFNAFAFKLVKVDRQVLTLDGDERMRQLVAVVDAVRPSGISVIVEGVESANHHIIVSQSGADLGQGFFYARSMGINLLRTFLEAGGTSLRVSRARLK